MTKKPVGWRKEHARHVAAGKGIPTDKKERYAKVAAEDAAYRKKMEERRKHYAAGGSMELRSFTETDKYAWFGSGEDPQIATSIPVREWPNDPHELQLMAAVIADITGIGVHGDEGYFFKRTGSRKKALEIAKTLTVPLDIVELKRKGLKYISY